MSQIVLPLKEPVQPPADVSGTKRLRGEDASVVHGSIRSGSSVANELPPSKRIKTGWEWRPNDALKQKQEVVENVDAEERVSVSLEKMTGLISMTAGGEL